MVSLARETVTRPGGPRPPRGGLVTIAALLLVVIAAIGWLGGGDDFEPPPPLQSEELATYLRVAPTLHAERRAGAGEGQPAAAWADRPDFRATLDESGWTLADFLRIEGQVTAARLRIENPALFAAEFQDHDAPAGTVELVRPHLDRIHEIQDHR